ncbi:MAG: hypothetical protein IPO21_00810 [Bacteroidales bacterium]|nr:hypothetical protein [Bacteroidales bacterium]
MRFLFILFICIVYNSFGQNLPVDNFDNWNWESTKSEDWSNKYVNHFPPFDPVTEVNDQMRDVVKYGDYKKSMGWELIWAQFNGMYSYFILYNLHRSTVRVFFALEKETFSHTLVSLTFHEDYDNPGLLTGANELQIAPDMYYEDKVDAPDIMSVIVPRVGAENWGCADFIMHFDPYTIKEKYKNKDWRIEIWGCLDFGISLKESKDTLPRKITHQISGGSFSDDYKIFNAQYAKVNVQIGKVNKGVNAASTKISELVTEKSPCFLQDFDDNVSRISDGIEIISNISSTVGTLLGVFESILAIGETFSSDGTSNSKTSGTGVFEKSLELTGTMSLKHYLGGNTIKIPGVEGNILTKWNPYNCTLGVLNLEKTPTIQKTSPYLVLSTYSANSKGFFIYELGENFITLNNSAGAIYMRKDVLMKRRFVKYKFTDDISIAFHEIPGLSLEKENLKFALVFTLSMKDDYYNPFVQYYTYDFFDAKKAIVSLKTNNLLYKYLDEGTLKIYKLDENTVEIGTPLLSADKLKDIVLEIPEKAKIGLRVVSLIDSDIYGKIVYQSTFNLQHNIQNAKYSCLLGHQEQTNFKFNDFYQLTPKISISSINSQNNTAGIIEMTPRFCGASSFETQAKRYLSSKRKYSNYSL